MIRAALIAAFVGGVALVSAQTPAPSPSAVTFEVASIKPAVPGQPTASDRFSPERFYSRNTTLLTLVRLAYGWLPSFRVSGGRSEEHTSELQSQSNLVCRLLLEKKKK